MQAEAPAILAITSTSDEPQCAAQTTPLGQPTILTVPTTDEHPDHSRRLQDVRLRAPASARIVLTDPPYDRDSMPLWDDFAVLAEKVLVDGGVLLAYTGTMFLPEVIAALSKKLVYRWMLATVHEGPTNRIHSLNMTTGWSPVVMFTKGKYEGALRLPRHHQGGRAGEEVPSVAEAVGRDRTPRQEFLAARRSRGRSIRRQLHDRRGLQASGPSLHVVRHRPGVAWQSGVTGWARRNFMRKRHDQWAP